MTYNSEKISPVDPWCELSDAQKYFINMNFSHWEIKEAKWRCQLGRWISKRWREGSSVFPLWAPVGHNWSHIIHASAVPCHPHCSGCYSHHSSRESFCLPLANFPSTNSFRPFSVLTWPYLWHVFWCLLSSLLLHVESYYCLLPDSSPFNGLAPGCHGPCSVCMGGTGPSWSSKFLGIATQSATSVLISLYICVCTRLTLFWECGVGRVKSFWRHTGWRWPISWSWWVLAISRQPSIGTSRKLD